jgi:hypothetical protein
MSLSILAPSDAQDLEAAGLAGPISPAGTRSIHKRRLNRWSDEEYSHLPLNSISVSTTSTTGSFITIPAIIVSLATLEYLGFNNAVANNIWAYWTNWPGTPGRYEVDPDGEIRFIEVAVAHLYPGVEHDTWDDDDQSWHDCMDICGIKPELQASIMNPIYKRIRLTESCYFWMKDTMKLRYRGLEAIQKASGERAKALDRQRGPRSRRSGPGGRTETFRACTGVVPGRFPSTPFSKAARFEGRNSPDSITLYKVLDQARLEGLFNNSGKVVAWQALLSRSRTDFSRGLGFNFAVDQDISEDYACYAKRRDGASSVAVMQIAIPNHKVRGLSTTQLKRAYWPSPDWKDLVWHCRARTKLPTHLQKFKTADLIIGTIAKKPSKTYEMGCSGQINESCVLKTRTGHNAVQYVFPVNDNGWELLEELAEGNVSVHRVTDEEFHRWEAEHEEDSDQEDASDTGDFDD